MHSNFAVLSKASLSCGDVNKSFTALWVPDEWSAEWNPREAFIRRHLQVASGYNCSLWVTGTQQSQGPQAEGKELHMLLASHPPSVLNVSQRFVHVWKELSFCNSACNEDCLPSRKRNVALISPSLTALSLEYKCFDEREERTLFCLIVFF